MSRSSVVLLTAGSKIGNPSVLSKISLKHEWDAALVVVLTEDFEPTVIYEADRAAISKALTAPGSKSRNERGQLGLSKFKSIAGVVWKRG